MTPTSSSSSAGLFPASPIPASIDIDAGGPDGVLRIAGCGDAYQANTLHVALQSYLNGAARPRLDMSGLRSCDVLILQLLFAAGRTAREKGLLLDYGPLPGCVLACCQDLGVPVPGCI